MYIKFLFWLLVYVPFFLFSQPLEVTSVYPAQNSNSASENTPIQIDFNLPIDTVNIADKFVIFGNLDGLYSFSLTVEPSLQTLHIMPDSPFSGGETVHVTARSSLTGSSGESFSGFNWRFTVQPTFPTPPHFSEPVVYPQFLGWMYAPLFPADINADGHIDIVAPAAYGVRVALNDGQGNFSYHQYNYSNSKRLTTGKSSVRSSMLTTSTPITDVDLDGQMEIFLGAGIYEFGSDNIFHFIPGSEGGWDIKDMNGDGWADMITGEYIPGGDLIVMGIRYNDGSGHFGAMDSLLIDENVVDMVGGDFNNDGVTDIAYATQPYGTPGRYASLTIVYMSSAGDTLYREIYDVMDFPYQSLGQPSQVSTSDFNNDTYLDIFIGSNSQDYIVINDTQGAFLIDSAMVVGGGDAYHWTTFADITADGWVDLLKSVHISFEFAGSSRYSVNNNGVFTGSPKIEQRFDAAPYITIGGDFNGDGAIDAATLWDDGLHVYFNDDEVGISPDLQTPPKNFLLFQNYPNPFNGKTMVRFYLSQSSHVESAIYDITGKEVRRFFKKIYPAGNNRLQWDAKNNNGKEVSSGVYIWRVNALGAEKFIKMTLTR